MSRERPKGVLVHRLLSVRLLLAAAILSTLIALSACGSDESDSTAGGSGTTAAAAPKGAPLKLSVLYPKVGPNATPEIFDGAEVAAKAIDDAGGVAMRSGAERGPVELVSCDTDNTRDPSAPAACAKRVIDDGVVLDVAKYTLAGDEVDVFAKAGVALLGNTPFSQQDLTSPASYPLGGAAATLVPATAAALQADGAKKVAYLSLDIPAAHAAKDWIAPILEDPADLVDTVLLPTDPSADLTPYFARLAARAPDGVILGVPAGMMAQCVNGLRQAGYSGRFVATPFSLTRAAVKALGSEAEGLLSVSDYASTASEDVERIARFNEEMKRYAPDADRNLYSLNAWAAVHLAAEIAVRLPVVNRASLAAALRGRTVDLGIAPPFKLGTQDYYLPFPRVFRGTVQYQVVKDGESVPSGDGKFVDLNALAKK